MDKLYDNIMDRPLSGRDITNALLGETKILRYGDLKKYNSIDELLSPYNNISLLYETEPNYGHWVCVLLDKKNKTVEYFDPYGMFIDKPLDHIKENFKIQTGQDYPYLTKLLYECPYNVIYNNKKLQQKGDDIATCGRHIISRLTMADIPLKKYQSIMKTNKKVNPDDKVSFLTSGIHNN
jgi:hypothetical protein